MPQVHDDPTVKKYLPDGQLDLTETKEQDLSEEDRVRNNIVYCSIFLHVSLQLCCQEKQAAQVFHIEKLHKKFFGEKIQFDHLSTCNTINDSITFDIVCFYNGMRFVFV